MILLMMDKRASMLAASAAIAALVSGCSVAVDTVPDRGTLTAVWTVDNSSDPAACAFHAPNPAAGMEFELLVHQGRLVVAEARADCASFNVSLRLLAGVYDATATMVDPITRAAVSTTLPLPNVQIFEATETVVDIDFPPESFPGPAVP